MKYAFELRRSLDARMLSQLVGLERRQWGAASRGEGFSPKRARIFRIRHGRRVPYVMWYFPESDDGAVFLAGTARSARVRLVQGEFEGREALAFELQWAFEQIGRQGR